MTHILTYRNCIISLTRTICECSIFIGTMACALTLKSQVIRVSPAFCIAEDTVTIVYNAAEGNKGLINATPPVYAHTGVITSNSSNGNDWRYVIGNWGTADARVLMTDLGNQLYQIKFPIRKFYNVPAGEKILKMAFVFRNTNGSLVGRDVGGGDIFYPVYENTGQLLGQRILPVNDYIFIKKDSSFRVHYECSKTAKIQVYKNGELIDSVAGKTYERLLVADQSGQFDVDIICTDGINRLVSSFRYFVNLQTTVSEPPPSTEPGIQRLSPLSVRLALMAPGKQQVFVVGDFNDYKPDTNYLMKKNSAGDLFWLDISPLKPGFSHHYQYLVDGVIKVADPMSEVILDPWHDHAIDEITFPGLPEYPFALTSGNTSLLQTTPKEYIWQSQNFIKPDKENLLIYEVLIRDFENAHSFHSLIEHLDELVKMGVNAIELMPVNEFEGNNSWGYNASFPMAVDKYYGPPDRLKEFIDRAHQKGIAVILDVVFNHVFGQSPLAQLYWDPNLNKPASNSPFLNPDARHPFNVGFDVNHESPFTKRWVKQVLKYWIQEFRVDGFRFDLSKGFTQKFTGSDVNAFAVYDASRIRILKDYAQHIWNLDAENIVILEHFAENAEEKELSEAGMLLWGNMNYAFNQATMGYASNDLSGAWGINRAWNKNHLIAYMESHDEERLMYKNLQFGNSGLNYSVKDLNTALARQEMAFAFLLMIPGPKMIWQFGDLGYDYSINYCSNGTVNSNCRLDPKPIRWDYTQNVQRLPIRKIIERIQEFKNASQITHHTLPTMNIGEGFVKSIRYDRNDLNVLLVGNFNVKELSSLHNFTHSGWWYDILTGDSLWVADAQLNLTLLPGEYHLWVDRKISTTIEYPEKEKHPWSVFPNPAGHYFFIEGIDHLESCIITDQLGRSTQLQHKLLGNKLHYVELDHSLLPGVYFIGIKSSAGRSEYLKLIID